MKILITGGSGLLGQYLNIALSKFHECLTIYHNNIGNCGSFKSAKIDLLNESSLEFIFSNFHPQVLIHTAAVSTAALADQLDKNYVEKVNIGITQKIAQLCGRFNCKLIFTSTDLVYDGSVGAYLPESSKIDPISLYAETKVKAEQIIAETLENYIILRTALHFGIGLNHSHSFFSEMYEKIMRGIPLNLFTDQFRSPLELKY